MIDKETLFEFGAIEKVYRKGDRIFTLNDHACNYYQVLSGQVMLINYLSSGKEFIQQIFSKNESFGEAMLFNDTTYPYNAVAMKDAVILELSKDKFYKLLWAVPKCVPGILKDMANELYYKSLMAPEISCQDAQGRILVFLDFYKKQHAPQSKKFGYLINLTRQQIADLTGLRVETVIRTLKHLDTEGFIKINSSKIFI
ncbi:MULTISPECIES: Crp/Fnr family transcriptional regulator [Myroides]|uniref:Cyclic nucleotide-binding domain-containing protein n=1 Tax=Myroides albus TaxID=2562892 RepID=A0A6I3LPA1_9FLAO|nr:MULTISPECIES: Crp/Fnr family transcriptional regulator [Myroides]MTG98491.1 cyclic nucleotide-binding domain-containing protein [Myroides albus]MVX34675.1 cyclic nucleotide-binding domain-containing protein [Myroides sp. LoEW2-1]UVD79514.1 Crp/Fnr family transcriptional regulator [Myroides albus]